MTDCGTRIGHAAACLGCIGLQHSLKMVDVVDPTDCRVPQSGGNAAWGPSHASLHLQPANTVVLFSRQTAVGAEVEWVSSVCVGPEEPG